LKKKIVRLRRNTYTFRVFDLNLNIGDFSSPMSANVGDPSEVGRLYEKQIADFRSVIGHKAISPTPFCFPYIGDHRFGDFTSGAGQREFNQIRLELSEKRWMLKPPMQELHRFSELAQVIRFKNSEECACIRDFRLASGKPTFTVGQGPYEQVFATMNSQGLRFDVSEKHLTALEVLRGKQFRRELEKLAPKLKKRYGEVTIRKAIHDHLGGRLPEFGDQAVSYVLGTASLIRTSDGYVVFGRRAKRKVSMAVGISVPTAGGCKYNRHDLVSLGLPGFIKSEILREAEEECGITGIDCSVTVLAMVRELTRAGSPEILAVIEFFGTLSELVARMRKNTNPEQDVDAIFALPLADAQNLVLEPDADKALQSKGLVAMLMLDRYLKNGGVV
jgi:hypothetical protein